MTKKRSIDTPALQFEVEKINQSFSKAKIYVMYHGPNRNYTKISKEAVEKAMFSIKGIPIIGEFKEQADGDHNFGGHGGRLEIDDDDIRYVQTTSPIGFVPAEAEIYWKTVTDSKEQEKEYLVVDGAVLWNRYEKEISTLKKDNFGQSMEINVYDGFYDESDDLFDIKEFEFTGLCVLGIDKSNSDGVEPCFEDSKIIAYSLDKDKFHADFSQMISEYNALDLLNKRKEEVEEMPFDVMIKKYGLSIDDILETFSQEELKAFSLEQMEVRLKEKQEKQPEQFNKEQYEDQIATLTSEKAILEKKVEKLEAFKLAVEDEKVRSAHKDKANELFSELGLDPADVEGLDVHQFSYEELEMKSYALLGKKVATSKPFSNDKKGDNYHQFHRQKEKKTDDKYHGLLDN